MKLSNRAFEMKHSPIRKFNKYSNEAKEKGKKVYHLNIGQPDIVTPDCFIDVIKNFDEKVVAYSESDGEPLLLDGIREYFKHYGVDFEREDIIITNGGSEALSMVFTILLNPGDKVLMPEPFYSNYHTFITAAGGSIVPVTTKAEEGYDFVNLELLEGALTEDTKVICCTSPGNPTGRVLSMEDMKLICEFAKKHDLWILADEVYREFVYDNREVTSFSMLEEYSDRVIIVDSVSKRFSACGARIGFIASKNQDFMEGIMKIAQGRLCVSTLDQIGAAQLYRLDRSYYDEMRAEYESRRDAAYEEIMKIPGVICEKPGGAFYMMAKLPVDNTEDFLVYLLTEFEDNGETVMFAPAEGFYGNENLGSNEMRIAYVLNSHDMKRAVELIRLGIESYNNR